MWRWKVSSYFGGKIEVVLDTGIKHTVWTNDFGSKWAWKFEDNVSSGINHTLEKYWEIVT